MAETDKKMCAECGKPIPKPRLKALPHTEVCVSCAEQAELESPREEPLIDDLYTSDDCQDIITGD